MINPTTLLRRSVTLAAGPLVAIALLSGVVGTAHAADRTPDQPQRHTISSADIYNKGAFSIQMTLHNDTDQPLTLDPAKTMHSAGAHWGQQAQHVLGPSDSETVTAYTNNPTGMTTQVTYTLPNGEYATAMAQDLWISDNVEHDGVGTGWDNSSNWYQTADPTYVTDAGTHSGGNHIWADAPLGVATNS
jgi:hypothetical protein